MLLFGTLGDVLLDVVRCGGSAEPVSHIREARIDCLPRERLLAVHAANAVRALPWPVIPTTVQLGFFGVNFLPVLAGAFQRWLMEPGILAQTEETFRIPYHIPLSLPGTYLSRFVLFH